MFGWIRRWLGDRRVYEERARARVFYEVVLTDQAPSAMPVPNVKVDPLTRAVALQALSDGLIKADCSLVEFLGRLASHRQLAAPPMDDAYLTTLIEAIADDMSPVTSVGYSYLEDMPGSSFGKRPGDSF